MRTTTVADTHCPHCGLLIKEGNAPHWEEVDCIAALHARIAELEVGHRTLLDQVEFHRIYALDAEIEVQRLRGELDAQQWRPATVAPEQEGWYQVFDGEEWWYDHRFYSVSGWGVMGDMRPPTYWRPIPPMPEEAQ